MQLSQSNNFNINYSAKIVNIEEFLPHPNPECTKLKIAVVDGFNIAVSTDMEAGKYVYFPVECCINPSYLSANNLFRDANLNEDKNQKGFFEKNGRVRAIKLQKVISEGFIAPVSSLVDWLIMIKKDTESGIAENTEFDTVEGVLLCKKYVVEIKYSYPKSKQSKKVKKSLIKIDDSQFRFHYDTVIIKRCPWVIHPCSLISITYKMNGTSGISSYVLCKKPLTKFQKFLSKFKHIEQTRYYDYIWSSRKVIKNPYYNPKVTKGFYEVDVWKYAHDVVAPKLKQGMTIYYEICGYLPNNVYIQKGFDYGCVPSKDLIEYEEGKNFKIYVYRITYTGNDGTVFEFSAKQVQIWCKENGLVPVIEAYYGYAKDLYPDIKCDDSWSYNFINKLSKDENFYMELDSPHCINRVPNEGLVIKIEDFKSAAYKLKTDRFLNKETRLLDSGYEDIEEIG